MKYVGQDLPFTNNPRVQAAAAATGAVRAAVTRGLQVMIDSMHNRPVDAPFCMCYGIVLRLLECSLSLEVLVAKDRQRDAGVLLLTLIELRLDLQYASQDASRVLTWLANTDRGRKPWRVAHQIKAIFPDQSERDAALENYRHFSMVKHGNPAGGAIGFPVGLDDDALSIFDKQLDHNLGVTCLFGAGVNLRDGFLAATVLLGTQSPEFTAAIAEIEQRMHTLNSIHTDHVYEMLGVPRKPPSGAADA